MAKQGGAREGAGRKRKYNNPATIAFTVEKEDKDLLKDKFGSKLRELFEIWINGLKKL